MPDSPASRPDPNPASQSAASSPAEPGSAAVPEQGTELVADSLLEQPDVPVDQRAVDQQTADQWERQSNRTYLAVVVAGVTFVALLCVAYLLPVPYVTMRPGPAVNTLGEFNGKPMISFGEGVKTYRSDGALDFTTVSVTRPDGRLNLGSAVKAYFDPDVQVLPREAVYPKGESAKESRNASAAQMTSSKDTSRASALRAAGYRVPEQPKVVDVIAGGPSEGKLKAGDLFESIDGARLKNAQAVVKAVSKVSPGRSITIKATRDGKAKTIKVKTQASPDDPQRAIIGVLVGTRYEFPVEIENNVGDDIGGPSAGTMFALAIYDRLTPGSLTGGRRVAGSGEISGDGTVGGIGGIRQKMVGAAQDGASIFLVPKDNCEEAVGGDDYGMTLVEVAELDDAIEALQVLSKVDDPAKAKIARCQK